MSRVTLFSVKRCRVCLSTGHVGIRSLSQYGYFCPSRRKGKMSLAGARESRSAGDAGSCQRWRSRARGVSTEACSAPVFSQIGKKYPPAYTGDLTDLRSGLVGVFVQDSGVF